MLAPLHCPDGVTFDHERHVYTLDGVEAPSVSAMMKVVDPEQYAGVQAEVLERASMRGQACHEMIACDVRSELATTMLDGELAEDYLAWDQFRHDFDFECSFSEAIVVSRRHRYCGTLDLQGKLTSKGKRQDWLVDIKRVAATPVLVGPQTAGYRIAAAETYGLDPNMPRGVLWIQRGAKYRFIECKNPADNAVFISARTILTWRDQHGK